MLKHQIKQFCKSTTLHGFKYVAEDERKLSEKIFWTLSLLLSMILTSVLIHNLFRSYNKNPIVIGTDESQISVKSIYFPSITICPSLIFNVKNEKTIDYTSITKAVKDKKMELESLSLDELKYMQIISLVSRDDFFSSFNISIPTDDFIEKLNKFPNFFRDNQHNFNSALDEINGNWSDHTTVNLTRNFCPTGICHTFNFPNSSQFFNFPEISPEFNYTKIYVARINKSPIEDIEYPLKGPNHGLGILMRLTVRQYRKGTGRVYLYNDIHQLESKDGYHLIFHDPFEIPWKSSLKFQTVTNSTIDYMISPELTEIDESLFKLTSEERNCYLPNEKKLQFFKVYNKMNCEHECLASATLDSCRCVQFFMTRSPTTRICGVADEKCFRAVEESFPRIKDSCKCFDSCRRLKYDVQVLNLGAKTNDYELKSIFRAKFKVDKFFPQKLRVQFTAVEFIAYVGGLLGLFAGFSVISLAEFLYFICFRPLMKSFNNKIHPFPPQNRRKLNFFVSYFFDYLRSSTIGCFNFIATEKSKIAKILWLTISVAALYQISKTTWSVFQQFTSEQISISLDGRAKSIDEIPFPAITFVSDFQPDFVELNYAANTFYLETLLQISTRNFTAELIEKYVNDRLVAHHVICYDDTLFLMEKVPFNYSNPSVVLNELRNTSQTRSWWNERRASWNSKVVPHFTETLTRHGIGYTFNMIDINDMLKFKYVSDDFKDLSEGTKYEKPNPWRTTADKDAGLKVTLPRNRFFSGKFERCRKNSFTIHDPFQLPSTENSHVFGYGKSIDVMISAEVIETDNELRSIGIDKRQCYFEGEKKLGFFKVYTKYNCEMECNAFFAYVACNCYPFSLVRERNASVCTVQGMRCVWQILHFDLDWMRKFFGDHCNCLPTCNSVSYNVEFITEKYDKSYNKTILNETTINFRFKENMFYPLRRYRRFTFENFLSNAGGLMGLLAGASLLSIVEFVYFFSLRGFFNVWKFLKASKVSFNE